MSQTIAQKILARACGRPRVEVGDIVFPEPDLVVVHDGYACKLDEHLAELGARDLVRPERVLVAVDHQIPAATPQVAERLRALRGAVERFGIGRFYDVGRGGNANVIPVELGVARPGMLAMGYDIHVTNYGAVGCLAIPVGFDVTGVLAVGTTWIQVPATVAVELRGRLAPGVTVRDVAQRLLRTLPPAIADYRVIEYRGPFVHTLDIDGRMTLCNTPMEVGAKSVVFNPDDTIDAYLAARGHAPADRAVASDPGAEYERVVSVDVGDLAPQVAVPPRPDLVQDVGDVAGTRITRALVGSCAGGMLDDLRQAASVLRGRRVSDGVTMLIVPATQAVYGAAAREGLLQVFADAGATVFPPGCGPCAGGVGGPLGSGDVCIASITRNDPGRMGAADAAIYLASAATVAASAVAGEIADPRSFRGRSSERNDDEVRRESAR